MTRPAIPEAATGVLTIDLDQLAANWRALAKLVAPAECGAVVKADAYGLGAEYVIPALVNAGCRSFFIATPGEAAQARFLAPDATIYALDGLLPGSGDELLAATAVPVLSSVAEVREWGALAVARKERLATALQVDSGLNRLGLSGSDVAVLAGEELLQPIDVQLVMSHLACADNPADPKNDEQRQAFEHRRSYFPGVRASLAASDGLMLGRAYHYDLVRPGYALYGGQASQAGPAPVGPVVTVLARILQVRGVSEGESVGYSATWRAKKQSRVAVIAAGYDDGIARGLSRGSGEDGFKVMIQGQLAPVIGRVSMDLITVDVSEILPVPERGELVELIGPGLSIESMGTAAGTIGYEVLTRLGRRFHRVYTGAGS
jgi:alanine racemase